MTKEEYRKLREYFEEQFDAIGRWFDAIDARLERIEAGVRENGEMLRALTEGLKDSGEGLRTGHATRRWTRPIPFGSFLRPKSPKKFEA